ncbi:hypothetical protein CAEBREN_05813 [Caenorhabditis brenneri]|uniref:SPK domain-containing protein n=1 Tax=Caenorhabditis brenneri TaxID=135651 RepID=G0NGQ7_CAEBE|nr:hypothetical protein CAEBREN_05813 [Caenorhabditis brenneri]
MTTNPDSDAALLNFIQSEASTNPEIRTMSIFCNDFNLAHPDHHAPENTIYCRIRKLLKKIDHEKYDDTILAKMMFFLAQPLVGVNLDKVKDRLKKSGTLGLDYHYRIVYYKNDEVELKGEHQRKNQRDRARDERSRRESTEFFDRGRFASLEMKFEKQMKEEARELGEREKAREEAQRRAEEERLRRESLNDYWGFDDPNVPSTSDQGRQRFFEVQADQGQEDWAPATKRVRVEVPGMVAQGNVQATLPEPPRPQVHEADSTVYSIGSSPAPNTVRKQGTDYDYYVVLDGIHNLTLVLEDPCLESLRAEIAEELAKPESNKMKIPQGRIAEALVDGINIVVKYAKSDNITGSIGLNEFMRLLKLQILNIGYREEIEHVTRITDIVNKSSQQMIISMAKVRFAMETIFEKIRQ